MTSSSGRQPNFAALNRGRHLYSAGRPSGWALAHISSILIILLTLTHRKINNHAPRQPFPRYSSVSYMLLAPQFKKDAPPETTCDAYTLLVIRRDVTSRQSFVARRTVWAGVANSQHADRLHCIMSTSRARSQMMQGKLTRC